MTTPINLMMSKADGGEYCTCDALISISCPIPAMPANGKLGEYHKFYAAEAKQLADVLFKALPGGTIDQLLIEMMQRKASLFRAPHDESAIES